MGQGCPKRKEMGQRSSQAMQRVKKAQSSMSMNPMTILGHHSQLREEYAAGLEKAQQAGVK